MSTIGATGRLRAKLPDLARGQVIIIDYFASTSACCGVVSGDITATFGAAPTSQSHVRVAELEGVPVFAKNRLVPLLEQTETSVDLGRLPFGRRLAVTLTPPERWLEFLETRGITRRGPTATSRRA